MRAGPVAAPPNAHSAHEPAPCGAHTVVMTGASLTILLLASGQAAGAAVITTALAREASAPAPTFAAPAVAPPSFTVPSLALAAPLRSALATSVSPVYYGEAAVVVPALAALDVRDPDARRAFTPVLDRLAAAGADTPAKIAATPAQELHLAVQQANADVQGRLRELGRRVFDGSGGFSAVSQDLGELRDLKAYGSPYLHNDGYNAALDLALETGPKNVVKLRASRKNGGTRRLSGALGLTVDPKLDAGTQEKIAAALDQASPLHAERRVLHRLRGPRGGTILVDMPYDAVAKDQIRMLIGRPGRMIEVPIRTYDTYGGGARTVIVTELGTLTIGEPGEEADGRWNDERLSRR